MQGNLNESTELATPQLRDRPAHPAALDQTPPSSKKPASLQQARTRKEQATISVLAGGDNTVAEVLERSRTLADEDLELKKETTARKLADTFVQSESQQLEGLEAFFSKYRSGDNDRLLAPYVDLIEGEVVP